MTRKSLTGLRPWCKLVIFSLLIFHVNCTNKKETATKNISIIWKDGRAVSLSIPHALLEGISNDSLSHSVIVRLSKHGDQPAIAGAYALQADSLVFEPVIPFTRGLVYQIFIREQSIAEIEIPISKDRPKLLSIYPGCDTVPENLLKIYLLFSKPMVEGHSLQYISLRNEEGDRLPGIFLDLQPELWNENRTMLTLWLDPGRIKRDLQPNKLLGPPLTSGRHYQLFIDSNWHDQEGNSLVEAHAKKIIAYGRDRNSPSPKSWTLRIPSVGSTDALEVGFHEAMDFVLLLHTIHILDPEGKVLIGTTSVSKDQTMYSFIPIDGWKSGTYKMEIESRLEDLAGNNLNRPFDRDLESKEKLPSAKVLVREFMIH